MSRAGKDVEQLNSHTLLVGIEIGANTLKNCQYPLNLDVYIYCDWALSFLGIDPREMKTKIVSWNGHSNIIHNSPKLSPAHIPINSRTNKLYNGLLYTNENEQTKATYNNMNESYTCNAA